MTIETVDNGAGVPMKPSHDGNGQAADRRLPGRPLIDYSDCRRTGIVRINRINELNRLDRSRSGLHPAGDDCSPKPSEGHRSMQIAQRWRSWPVRRLAAVALIGSLPALATVAPARHPHAPAAGSGSRLPATTASSGSPTQKRPATAKAAARHAAEVERLAVHISKTWKKPLPQSRRIVQAAFVHARKHRLSPTLVLAVVAQESSFRPTARSGYGAQGLMQVVPRHHPEKVKGIGPKALLTPETNIAVGTRVLAEYVERDNGQLHAALTRYSGKAAAYPRKVHLVWANLERVRSDAEASA